MESEVKMTQVDKDGDPGSAQPSETHGVELHISYMCIYIYIACINIYIYIYIYSRKDLHFKKQQSMDVRE